MAISVPTWRFVHGVCIGGGVIYAVLSVITYAVLRNAARSAADEGSSRLAESESHVNGAIGASTGSFNGVQGNVDPWWGAFALGLIQAFANVLFRRWYLRSEGSGDKSTLQQRQYRRKVALVTAMTLNSALAIASVTLTGWLASLASYSRYFPPGAAGAAIAAVGSVAAVAVEALTLHQLGSETE